MNSSENTRPMIHVEEHHGDEETFYSSLPQLQPLPPKTENDDDDSDGDYDDDDDFFTDDGDDDPFGEEEEDDGGFEYSNSSELTNDSDGTL